MKPLRLDCTNWTTEDTIHTVLSLCLRADECGPRPIVVLDNLDRVAGSLSRLLKAITQVLLDLDGRLILFDSSGYLQTYAAAIGRLSPSAQTARSA